MTTITTELNTLTVSEAQAICRAWNWGNVHVTERLHNEALAVWLAANPPVVVEYPPMDWYSDDGSEMDGQLESYMDWKQSQKEWAVYQWENR